MLVINYFLSKSVLIEMWVKPQPSVNKPRELELPPNNLKAETLSLNKNLAGQFSTISTASVLTIRTSTKCFCIAAKSNTDI